MTPEIWIALAAANFAAGIAPGQNVALVGAATARSGSTGAMWAIGGILVAEGLWTVLALLLTIQSRAIDPILLLAVQIASSGVLVWCGMRVLRSNSTGAEVSGPRRFCRLGLAAEGVWVGLANPLALAFFLAIFPGFVGASANVVTVALVTFCVSSVVLSSAAALLVYFVMSLALVRAGLAQRLNMLSGGSLLLVGVSALLWTVV